MHNEILRYEADGPQRESHLHTDEISGQAK